MNKALFWDFDGTLTHNNPIWTNSLYTILANHKYNIAIEEIRLHFRSGHTWFNTEISYTDSIGQKWWDRLFNHFHAFYENHNVIQTDIEQINAAFKDKITDYTNYILYEDANNVLHKCKQGGYQNYVLSNNFPELPLVIKQLGLGEYFIDYVVSANIGYEKPRIEIFHYALNIADFPEKCYMIGDNPVADIQGGKSAGMKTILVHNELTSIADYMCKSLSEIPLLLDL